MTACPSRGPMFGDRRPVCELDLDHTEPHGAMVDGTWVEWERTIDPELMLLPEVADSELERLKVLIRNTTKRYTGIPRELERELAEVLIAANYRKIPEGATVMVPAPEDDLDW